MLPVAMWKAKCLQQHLPQPGSQLLLDCLAAEVHLDSHRNPGPVQHQMLQLVLAGSACHHCMFGFLMAHCQLHQSSLQQPKHL